MIDPKAVSAGSASACQHLLAVSLVDYTYSNCVVIADEAGATSPNRPALPETLHTEGIALEKLRKSIFGLVEATTCFLKVNQFTLSVLRIPALSGAEKASLHDFFLNHSRSLDEHESVKEVEVPVAATEIEKGSLKTKKCCW